QNNFQLDGFNMNNDLDPANNSTSGFYGTVSRSQGLNIDTSLLESITVQDSNIGAAYGGFTGGVVEAKTKRPTKEFGASVSYQITQGNANPKAFSLTNYHIYDSNNNLESFLNSSSADNQPNFIKHLIRASVESKLNNNLGVIASLSTTQSFIPLQNETADASKKDQKRQSYNFFLKGYYDIGENLSLEGSYTYAPQYNEYFIATSRNSSYDILNGGHQLALKALLKNQVGILSMQANGSILDNSRLNGVNYQKLWLPSAEKNWSSAATQPEGTLGNFDTRQIDMGIKVFEDFEPLKLGFLENRFNVGGELGYVYAYFNRKEDYYQFQPSWVASAGRLPVGGTCTHWEWCSASPVIRAGESAATNGGQFFTSGYRFDAGTIALDNYTFGAWGEDDMQLDFGWFGEINTRLGVRLDYDTYMSKATYAPRFSLNYITPAPKELTTQITFGANRYYGRNIFAYALADGRYSLHYDITRTNETDTQWTATQYTNNTDFSKLKVPYADELMVGIVQRIHIVELGAKYIHRFGRDEVRMGCYNKTTGLLGGSCLRQKYSAQTGEYRYNNDGKSDSDIFSLSVQNTSPIQTYGISHYYLLAFDYTKVTRNYASYNTELSSSLTPDTYISWNGELMLYSERPATNFARPYTLRFNTTHTTTFKRTKWLLNNFFRLRSAHNTMVSTNDANKDSFEIDGVLTPVTTYRALKMKEAFNWDIRLGFEMNLLHSGSKTHILFVNVDVYNVLDSKNIAVINTSGSYGATSFSQTPVYEVGRQFWLQVGYKF
ncbi:TonB-dependent receptor, partial [Helicobacter sp. 23-1048]